MLTRIAGPVPPPDERSKDDPGYFPIFLALRDVPVLVVCGGDDAVAKVEALRRAGARVTVVAAVACDAITSLATAGELVLQQRAFIASDLDGVRLCVVAVEDAIIAKQIVSVARRRGVLVNAVDRPVLCDFIIPAVVERGPLRIAISTNGLAPALARELRRRIDAAVPMAFGELARFCGTWRTRVMTQLRERDTRRRFWESVLNGAEAEAILAGNDAAAARMIEKRLNDSARRGDIAPRDQAVLAS